MDVSWLITPAVFGALLRLCKNADIVNVAIADKRVTYRINNTIVHSNFPNGRYPDFKRVIPTTNRMECSVDKSELIDALGRLSLICNMGGCVKMDISRMDMTLTADNIDYMKKSVECLTHNGCDGEITIGVNADNAMMCTTVFDGNNVIMKMTDASRPILFSQEGNDSMCCIVMPMALTS